MVIIHPHQEFQMGSTIPISVVGGCSGAVTGGILGSAAAQVMESECKIIACATATGAVIGAAPGAGLGHLMSKSLTMQPNENQRHD